MNDNDGKESLGERVFLDGNVERDIVFRYSREHRLERASPAVRALNDGIQIKPSLRRTLFATRSNKLILLAVVLACAGFTLVNRLAPREAEITFGRNQLTVNIENVNGVLLLAMTKTIPQSGEFYTGTVEMAVSPIMPSARAGEVQEDPPVYVHRVVFHAIETEFYQTSLPFGGNDFLIILRGGNEHSSVRIRVNN